jgi:hypothetical protein
VEVTERKNMLAYYGMNYDRNKILVQIAHGSQGHKKASVDLQYFQPLANPIH